MKLKVSRSRSAVWLSFVGLMLPLPTAVAAEEAKPRNTLYGHSQSVTALAWRPDGQTLASAGGDQTIQLWDVAKGRPQAKLKGHAREIWSLAFSVDGKQLASASWDASVKSWNSATGQAQVTLPAHGEAASAVAT